MTLDKRAAYLILPVVLLGYVIATFGIYTVQRQSVLQLEKSHLELKLAELSSVYQAYSGFSDSYMYAMVEGKAMSQYLSDRYNRYREMTFASTLEKGLQELNQHNSKFLSFAIISHTNQPEYYFESSLDPFAEIDELQLQAASDFYRNPNRTPIRHLVLNEQRSLIINNSLLDSRTLLKPLETQENDKIVVQLAIEPTEFDKQLVDLKKQYQAEVLYSERPDTFSDYGVVQQLAPGYSIYFEPDLGVLGKKLDSLKLWLIAGFIFISSSTGFLLVWLIRRFITHPIAVLDVELDQLIKGKRNNLTPAATDDEVGRLSAKFSDLYRQLSETYLKTRELSEQDILTQLPNRKHFSDIATLALQKAKQERRDLAVFYIDLDNFKFVNDKYGHLVGDELLKSFASKLRKVILLHSHDEKGVHSEVIISRLSGDEFAMMTPIDSVLGNEKQLAERVLALFKHGFHFERGHFPVTASIGIAKFPEDGHNITQLISNADTAMYQAKGNGKNCVAYYSKALAQKERRSREIEQQLREIDYDQEFRLVYMPIVDASNQNIVGCEALLRWQSPALGFVGPDEFIPIAENTGLYEKVDYWVISQALKDFGQLSRCMGNAGLLSINLSSANLHGPGIDQHIISEAACYGVSCDNIELEITETYDISRSAQDLNVLKNLRQHGFKVAIDDFGTGYTSLTQMIELSR